MRRNIGTVGHPHLYWLQRTPRKKQAILLEPIPAEKDTPEHFYHYEMEVRSTLLERARVRGMIKEEDK